MKARVQTRVQTRVGTDGLLGYLPSRPSWADGHEAPPAQAGSPRENPLMAHHSSPSPTRSGGKPARPATRLLPGSGRRDSPPSPGSPSPPPRPGLWGRTRRGEPAVTGAAALPAHVGRAESSQAPRLPPALTRRRRAGSAPRPAAGGARSTPAPSRSPSHAAARPHARRRAATRAARGSAEAAPGGGSTLPVAWPREPAETPP